MKKDKYFYTFLKQSTLSNFITLFRMGEDVMVYYTNLLLVPLHLLLRTRRTPHLARPALRKSSSVCRRMGSCHKPNKLMKLINKINESNIRKFNCWCTHYRAIYNYTLSVWRYLCARFQVSSSYTIRLFFSAARCIYA